MEPPTPLHDVTWCTSITGHISAETRHFRECGRREAAAGDPGPAPLLRFSLAVSVEFQPLNKTGVKAPHLRPCSQTRGSFLEAAQLRRAGRAAPFRARDPGAVCLQKRGTGRTPRATSRTPRLSRCGPNAPLL